MKLSAAAASLFGLALISVRGATLTITSFEDSGPGTLRQAISDANATPGDDTIIFATNGTIALASPLPPITENLSIVGAGTNQSIISGGDSVQIFYFNPGTTNTLSNLTIANGLASGYANGGAIANAGNLTILGCALINNTNLFGWGGAIFNSGNMTLSNSIVSGNRATAESGSGISGGTGGGGGAAGLGGGLFSTFGTVTLNGCVISDNASTAGNGGGSGAGTGRGGGTYGGAVGVTTSSDPAGPGGAGGYGSGGGGGGFGLGGARGGAGGQGGFGGGGGGGGGGGNCCLGSGGAGGYGGGQWRQ